MPDRAAFCGIETLEPRTLMTVQADGFTESAFASGLTEPTAMDFAPDGRLFVCEQGGAVRVIKDGALLPSPFATLDVDSFGERGLLGIAFDPDFGTNRFVYVYWTATTPTTHNRVSRFTAAGDAAVPGSRVDILDLPELGPSNHNGGAIHFGPDGKLYVAAGENADASLAQRLDTPLGKILRINKNGSIPSDNPFFEDTTGQARAIWAYGLRNPYTFAFQPGTGKMHVNDVGGGAFEEVNVGAAGANFGWPESEGPTTDPGVTAPLHAYDRSAPGETGCAITGGAFYNPQAGAGSAFPASFTDDYFYADWCGGYVRQLDAETNAVTTFATDLGGPVDLKVGPDGRLYALTHDAGGVVAFAPTGSDGNGGGGATGDLAATIVATPSTSAVGGTNAAATVRVTNAAADRFRGAGTVSLIGSTDATLDDADAALATVTRNLRLAPGGGRNVRLTFAWPDDVDASFTLFARVTGPAADANPADNVSPAAGPVALTRPFVNLTGTFRNPAAGAPGERQNVLLSVRNEGNVLANGRLAVAFALRADGGGSGDVELGASSRRVRIKPDGTVAVRLKATLPSDLPPGTYRYVASIDTGGQFTESDEGDNTVVGEPFQL